MASQVLVQTASAEESPRRTSWPGRLVILGFVFVVAFVARLLPVLLGGGFSTYGRYDDGVYYTAAESLSFGHLPYRDFVLLHPPGIALALLPFTLLGRVTTDPTGMTTARIAFMVVGALSAVLVALIASRWGWARGAFAGLLYAASAAAIFDEETTLLEPLGTLFTLVAVWALDRRTPRSGVRLELVAGAALGLACSMKIWYAALLLTVVLVIALRRELWAAARVLAAAVVTTGVVMLPFFAQAPSRMWTMIVTDQLGRHVAEDRIGRIRSILGIDEVFGGAGPGLVQAATVVIVVLLLVALAFCLADRDTWLIAGLFVVAAVILLASPSYFRHYGVLLAAPVALLLPVGLGKALRLLPPVRLRVAVGAVCAALVLASGVRIALSPTGESFPGAALAAAAPAGCIATDDPTALIGMNRLTQGFRSHCDIPVDVTGTSFGAPIRRAGNPEFHAWLMEHLTSGDAFVVLRPRADPIWRVEQRLLGRYPLLASVDGLELRTGNGGPSPETGEAQHWFRP